MSVREILDRTDLASLLTELTGEPTMTGRLPRWHCCARDHDDEQPSVTMFRDHRGVERWKCWSGNHAGTAVDAVIAAQGVSTAEAVRLLETRAGLEPVTRPVGVPAVRVAPAELSEAARDYANRCANLLWTPAGTGAREWLQQRGLTDDVLRTNLVGFDPGVRAMRREDGLPKTLGGVTYASFDVNGALAYVQCRNLDPRSVHKYANPTAAHGRKPPISFARQPHPHGGPVVVGEGVADSLIATTAGFRAAAILDAGSVTPAALDSLATHAGQHGVVLAIDNDPAGNGALAALRTGLTGRTPVRVLRLATGHDLTDHYQPTAPTLVAAR